MKALDTEEMRRHFLIDRVFEKDKVSLVYSHIDRIIAGAVCPAETELRLEVTKELGVDTFLQRREMGIINVESAGAV
jgi:4-deoxy-L-threo-5-hexosulose-uronate ketol-isomerase